MHIEINQSLQKVAANVTRKFLTEEVDWVLNKIQDRFVRSCLRPVNPEKHSGKYTFVDQLRADSLKSIVVSKQLTAYSDETWSRRQKAILPPDYTYLLSDSSQMSLVCNRTLSPLTTTQDLTYLKLVKTTASSAPYYATGSITIGTVTINIPADLGMISTYVGFQAKEDLVLLIDWILNQFWKQKVEVYWERYGEIYKQGHFIIPGSPAVSLTWDATAVTASSSSTYNLVNPDRSGDGAVEVDNRLMATADIATYLHTPFFTTSVNGPISELATNLLYVYRDNNCTVKSVRISYVRKPQPISLLLGSDCELSPQVHQTICDLAVEYLKNVMEDPTTPLKTQDLETRVIF